MGLPPAGGRKTGAARANKETRQAKKLDSRKKPPGGRGEQWGKRVPGQKNIEGEMWGKFPR